MIGPFGVAESNGIGHWLQHDAPQLGTATIRNCSARPVEGLRGGGADEAPECYKDLKQVLAAHGDTIKILHTLRPIGVAMAGKDTFDRYRD